SSARRLAQSGMVDARRALQTLRQDEIPGPARLPYLAAETASALGIPVTLQVAGTPHALSPEVSLTVYRAVQEALTNVAKHAGRVRVADDQRGVRDGRLLLLSRRPGSEGVGAAVDGEAAVNQALSVTPDVVLMDLHMPICDGIEATRRLASARPGIPVVVLTS